MKLILLRHGESKWNLENRFTGWTDVPLTSKGVKEASFSGKQLLKKNVKIVSVYTSLLKRAIETANIVSEIIKYPKQNIKFDWRLNERHYGALQGLNKSETAIKYGEDKVLLWRRSYDVPPPALDENDERHPKFDKTFQNIQSNLPKSESLKNVLERLNPFLKDYFNFIKNNKGDHLVVAHSNSLRAIIKILDNLSKEEIISVNIPTGVPLIYTFDNDLNVIDKEYLIDKDSLKEKQEMIENQGKIQ
ncbi:2,3-bisphosphoglycerate-dependent phosphoglycerate mutase [Candidatus Marinimicrobia bacterium]|nr:2,3-bisphosphoglycerate-dependent phosphoglycerate mutase [Candidatus Neomarinimicrobiota bacterium]